MMLRIRRLSLVVAVLAGLLGVSSVAMAEHEESHPEDTVFSFGYDALSRFLAINLGSNDTLYECVWRTAHWLPLMGRLMPMV